MALTAGLRGNRSRNHVWLGMAILLMAILLGFGVYWLQRSSLAHRLIKAQAAVGSKQGDALLEDLIAEYPDHPEVLLLHARQMRLKGQNTRALLDLKRAADIVGPTEAIERERLLTMAQEDFSRTEASLQARLDTTPDDREIRLALAAGYAKFRYYSKAEALLNPLLDNDPDDGDALYVRGRCRLVQGYLDLAASDLDRALRQGHDQYYESAARFMLASCLLDLGRYQDALRLFRECRVEAPGNAAVLMGLGRSARLLAGADPNYLTEAEEAFKSALRLRPGEVNVLLELSHVYEEQSDLQQSLVVLEEAEKRNPDRYEVYFRLARILRALGQTERAAAYQKRYEIDKAKFIHQKAGLEAATAAVKASKPAAQPGESTKP